MPVSIDEVVAEVEPTQQGEAAATEQQPAPPSPEAEMRRHRTLRCHLEGRAARVRAD